MTALSRTPVLVISIQVLQEYFAAATWKLSIDPETAQQKISAVSGN
jgi:hypothetical protein